MNNDATHEDRTSNLTFYDNGIFWDVTEKYLFPNHILLKHGWIVLLKGFTKHREHTDERTFTRPIKTLR